MLHGSRARPCSTWRADAAKAVSSPLLKPIYPVKVKTMIKLAGKLGVDEKMLSLAGGFLQTIDKN